jgi:hypothetical protein
MFLKNFISIHISFSFLCEIYQVLIKETNFDSVPVSKYIWWSWKRYTHFKLVFPSPKNLPSCEIFMSVSCFFCCCIWWECIAAFSKVLTLYQIYHTWIYRPPTFSFILPSLYSWNSFNRSHFPFTYMCAQYLHHIHLSMPFPHLLPLPTGAKSLPSQAEPVLPSCFVLNENSLKKCWKFYRSNKCLGNLGWGRGGLFLLSLHILMWFLLWLLLKNNIMNHFRILAGLPPGRRGCNSNIIQQCERILI